MKFLHVVGARPNFMKVAPVMAALRSHHGVEQLLIHTGQHYDANMSDIFFQQLGIPTPDINLGVGSGSHAVQTAQIMIKMEEVVSHVKPDIVVVYGDVNSTVAVALVCSKLLVPVAHVEAGLRSFDRTMPEEINRLVTDQIATLLFTPSTDGNLHLAREGVAEERVHLVGNVMIDTLIRLLPKADEAWHLLQPLLPAAGFVLVTLHRPANVDDAVMLKNILHALNELAEKILVVFPIHPRTRRRIEEQKLSELTRNLLLMEPLSYLDFLALQQHAIVVVTDSGGIQEETTYLGIPCVTVRDNTERPVTVTVGTNVLVGRDMVRLQAEITAVLAGRAKKGSIPDLWDGHAGERIAETLVTFLS
jgi:UDP-N-acetylglucosamine 2-epimerase (non-hydrolysing)